MGSLYYGDDRDPIEIEDRLLAHVKVVVATKLRRNESFTLSWRHASGNSGRSTIWIQPSIPLRFVFDSAEAESLDSELLTTLAASANSSGGMSLTLEHEAAAAEQNPAGTQQKPTAAA
ncbi:hypothetical protein LQ938_13190 [Microbacterium sp. cx-55]|uniref:DUF7882 family protein n=1 Tax=unclassified Microbacterium TaxID=2609290 RepID=UPI001CC0E2C4|nr:MULTISPECIES: hypothetical protein [unclassified Microbacterium]MBZ4487779.1 hypothetical protein [Microbacterium sp. cx-55]MCC4909195.1 hypothetical protein [Microbacterium sp. cx-59]UGB34809.1 hypothetical protein LQ938_13190 [Microbacterium sp. cx-55]